MSGYLVDQIDATAERGSLTAALAAVYCHLAKTWMSPFPALKENPTDWRGYARRMKELNEKIEVPAAKHVSGGKWAAAEILNSLNHVEVLLCAGLALEKDHWVLKRCAPTQQHLAEGEQGAPSKIADLEGKDDKGAAFALEAYGGVDYRHNSKLAQDLNALRLSKKQRLLLAARGSAWPSHLSKVLAASCEKKNGGPFKIEATVGKTWECEHIVTIEMTDIVKDKSVPQSEVS